MGRNSQDQIIGPYFFDGNVTQESYLGMLQSYLEGFLNNLPQPQRSSMFFQQDGAPPHFATIVRNYLHEQFPGRWIGRQGTVEWPPRSPDLSSRFFPLGSSKVSRLPTSSEKYRRAQRGDNTGDSKYSEGNTFKGQNVIFGAN